MRITLVFRFFAAFAIFLFTVTSGGYSPLYADELDGDYQAQGQDAKGSVYQGQVRIQPLGTAKAILWRLESGEAYKGLGLAQEGVFAAAYGAADTKFGVVLYRIKGGTLDGRWTSPDLRGQKMGREVLEGSPSLNGEYRIVLGENPDESTNYTGSARIKRVGDIYLFVWYTPGPSPSALGIGIRKGDTLAVSYGPDLKGIGVVLYEIEGGRLDGVWTSGAQPLGKELLTKIP